MGSFPEESAARGSLEQLTLFVRFDSSWFIPVSSEMTDDEILNPRGYELLSLIGEAPIRKYARLSAANCAKTAPLNASIKEMRPTISSKSFFRENSKFSQD